MIIEMKSLGADVIGYVQGTRVSVIPFGFPSSNYVYRSQNAKGEGDFPVYIKHLVMSYCRLTKFKK